MRANRLTRIFISGENQKPASSKDLDPIHPPPPTIGPVSSGFFRFVSFAASVSFHFAERMDDSSVPSFQ